ncbi:MAG: ribonuclease P protein component [Candidatus Paceibacterota bacterium]
MLPKKNRTTKKEVENLFKRGSTLHGSVLFLKYSLLKEQLVKKASFVVPKKLEKGAFHRNTLKRKGYNALLPYLHTLPVGFLGVFTFKEKGVDVKTIQDDIKKLCNKIN